MNAGFGFSKFCKYVSFENATFSGYAAFQHSQFIGEANFSDAHFSEGTDAYFFEAKFMDNVFFWSRSGKNIIFGGDANFQHTEFHKLAEFYQARFLRKADFICSRFDSEDARFMNTQFDEIADFKGARFNGEIIFVGARFKKELDLRGIKFTNLKVRWGSIKNQLVCDGQVFLALIKNFKISEQFEDADECYYEYRMRNKNDKKWLEKREKSLMVRINWSKLYDNIAWITCGYGVRLRFVLIWIFGLIFVFALLFGIFDRSQSFQDSLYLSAMAFTISIPSNLAAIPKIALFGERVLGSLLLPLLVVILTKKMIR